MIQQTNIPQLELGGSPEEQELGTQVWNLMRMRGFTFAVTRPISLSLEALSDYFIQQKYKGLEDREQVAALIDRALTASPAVFLREEAPGEEAPAAADVEEVPVRPLVTFKTTKSGKAPPSNVVLDQHSFKTRLNQSAQPVAAPTEEELAARHREHTLHPVLSVNLPVAAPAVTAAQAAGPVITPARPATVSPATPAASAPAPAAARPAATPVTPAAPPQPAARPVTPPTAATAQPASRPATPAPVQPAPAPAASPVPVITGPIMVEVADGLTVDINRPVTEVLAEAGAYFASALLPVLNDDFRFVNFADSWYLEDLTARYGKNDFRRIREFMLDEGPVSDRDILKDVWGKRQTDYDYEATRFALNFRLYKEKKDFEFVGSADDFVWTASGLAQIGNPRHKATEIGTDFKFLEDANLNDPSELVDENGVKVWRHVLTFYEYENGVLPFNATAKEMFPPVTLEEQKSLILRFEAPQLEYFPYTAELRYPTGSRGGWIGGLEQFFVDNLVPGAILVIRQGERSNHFYIEYDQSEEQNANVLLFDERRQKFVFRPIVFACGVEAEGMLTPERYSKLNGQKRMEESDRKKTDQVVMMAFENCGQKSPQGFYALLDDLYPIANIERPFSRNYLRHLLTHGNSQFQADETTPDAFYYKPPTTGVRR